MDFDEISNVVPWIEMATDIGIDLDAEQVVEPRVFKTHFWYPSVPKGAGKYIVVFRDPNDVAVSFYNFFKGWFFPAEGDDSVSVDDFVEHFILRRGKPKSDMENASLWDFMLSWLPLCVNDVNAASAATSGGGDDGTDPGRARAASTMPSISSSTMLIFFEDMKDDLQTVVSKVAAFIGVDDDERVQNAVRMSSFAFMKQHERHFDEHVLKAKRNTSCGLPPEAGTNITKVSGVQQTRDAVQLSPAIQSALNERWARSVAAETGFESYAAMRRALGISKCNENTAL